MVSNQLLLQQVASPSFFCSLLMPSAALVRWLESLLLKTEIKRVIECFGLLHVPNNQLSISFGGDPHFHSLPFITHVPIEIIEIMGWKGP